MLAGLVASPTKYAPAPQHGRSRASASATCSATCARTSTSPTPSTRPRSPSRSRSSTTATSTTSRRRTSSSTSGSSRPSATATRKLFKGGLKFYSTLDTRMQAAAESALRKGLESLDRRLGFRGPIGSGRAGPARRVDRRPRASDHRRHRRHHRARRSAARPSRRYGAMVVELPRGGVASIVDLGPRAAAARRGRREGRARAGAARQTARTAVKLGDLLPVRLDRRRRRRSTLAQRPALQGAMVVMEPSTGRVRRARRRLRLDRVSSSTARPRRSRQVGSSIKPFIYAAALEAGRTPGRPDARRPVLGDDRDRRVDAGELRQQVHGQRSR